MRDGAPQQNVPAMGICLMVSIAPTGGLLSVRLLLCSTEEFKAKLSRQQDLCFSARSMEGSHGNFLNVFPTSSSSSYQVLFDEVSPGPLWMVRKAPASIGLPLK